MVKIKTFKELKNEYSVDNEGDVKIMNSKKPNRIKAFFTKELDLLLPKDRVIDIISQGNLYIWYPNENEDEEYLIVDEMIEKILNPEEDPEYFI